MAFSSLSTPLLEKAFTVLQRANELEDEGKFDEAYRGYQDAVNLLKRHVQGMESQTEGQQKQAVSSDWQTTKQLIHDKIRHYKKHSEQLLGKISPSNKAAKFTERANEGSVKGNNHTLDRTRSWEQLQQTESGHAAKSNAYLSLALQFDEAGDKAAAIDNYLAAAEALLPVIKSLAQPAGEKKENDIVSSTTINRSYQSAISSSLNRRIQTIMDRVEELKKLGRRIPNDRSISNSPPRTNRIIKPKEQRVTEQHYYPSTKLTAEEIEVLKRSSLISSGIFLPWLDEEIHTFDFTNKGKLWNDPDGLLELSPTQKESFYAWKRPTDIVAMHNASYSRKIQRIKMIQCITPYTICQKAITDCSFIASLCVCAAYERRFGKRLVTSIIYPQNNRGAPIYNKYGVYMVKLWLNGVARRVLVDDLLPVDGQGTLLCSHTTACGNNKDTALEFWVPIIEKAYMKLCGGYDFPGSNSTVDLFSLTGWIPERIYLPENDQKIKDFETHRERAWERLYFASNLGDCLITLANDSNLSKEIADEIGLVTNHAYAVLSVFKTRKGIRLLQLKNPWAQKSWRGRFSCHDKASWADKALQMEVGYDPITATERDDGVFWICWEDVLVYFSKINLSWNPSLFSSKVNVHGFWPATQGPANDSFNVSENPQYILTISDEAIQSKSTLWILLSRHVDKYEQEGEEVTDFLTPFIHRNISSEDLILYPSSKTCVFSGAYTNSPHILARYDIMGPRDKFLSVVLSRYRKSKDLGYTLSCYCTGDFSLSSPIKTPSYVTQLSSEWTDTTSGGNPSKSSYLFNPMWRVMLPKGGAQIQLKCYAAKTIFTNLKLIKSISDTKARESLVINSRTVLIDTGDYRDGFAASAVKLVPEGSYVLVASTFEPGEKGPFMLNIHSSIEGIHVNQI